MFITFEGIEGSGKTTLIKNLEKWLLQGSRNVIVTREPGDSFLGRHLRALLLDPSLPALCSNAELFLFLADRAQHVNDIIKPALQAEKFVLCDRFTQSTLAYQGAGRGIDKNLLKTLCDAASNNVKPDLIFLLDLPVEVALQRVKARNSELENSSETRFDDETTNFYERVRINYLEQAENSSDMIVIDANRPPYKILRDCVSALEKHWAYH